MEQFTCSFRSRLKAFLYAGTFLCMLASCVPNKRLVYLQHDRELKKKTELPKDTALRSYSVRHAPYRLKPDDIISIRVASVTDNDYNFINKYQTDLGIIRKLNQYNTGNQGQGTNQLNPLGNRGLLGSGSNNALDSEGGLPSVSLDQLNAGFVLDINGKLNLPQIGEIQLAGLTIPEAEHKIRQALEGFFETPMVRVQLLNFHFTMLGEVENEGRFTSYDPDMTIFDAIAISGNLTEFADRANIKIVRGDGEERKVIYLNTLDESVLAANHLYLQRGDIIVVPPLEARAANKYTVPNFSRTLGFISAAISLTALIITLNR